MLKRILCFSLFVCVFVGAHAHAQANPLLSEKFWETASLADVQEEIKNGADANARDGVGWTPLERAIDANASPEIFEVLIKNGADVKASLVRSSLHTGTNLETVELLIKNGADVNARGSSARTPLMYASIYKTNPKIIEILIKNSADVNARDDRGKTALQHASYYNPEIATILVKNGAKDLSVPAFWKTAKLAVVQEEIKNGVDVNTKSGGTYGDTLLVMASENGHLDIVKYLIEQGADVHAGSSSYTALMKASNNGHLEVVKYLVKKGADVNARTEYINGYANGYPALMMAAENGHLEVVKFLLENGADANAPDVKDENLGTTSLMVASGRGHIEIVKLLIANGADVHAQQAYGGATAVDWASNPEIIELLVEHGPTNIPLINAAESGDIEKVRALIKEGADVNARASNGDTALGAAYGDSEMVTLFIKEGADINQYIRIETILMKYSSAGDFEMVQYLVENGADISLGTENTEDTTGGITALMMAEERGHTEIANYLVEKGADINAQDGERETALMKASKYGQLESVQYLVENGADVSKQGYDGKTALDIARATKNTEVVEYLEGIQ